MVTPKTNEDILHGQTSYNRVSRNPDREPTNRENDAGPAPVEIQEYSLDLATIGEDGGPEQEFKQVESYHHYLFRRNFGGWYARLPDQKVRGTRRIPAPGPDQKSKTKVTQTPNSSNTCTYMFFKLPWDTDESYQKRTGMPTTLKEPLKKRKLNFHRFHEDYVENLNPPYGTPDRGQRSQSPPPAITHLNGGDAVNGVAIGNKLAQGNVADGNMPNPPHLTPEPRQPPICQSRTSQSMLWQHGKYKYPSLSGLRDQVTVCKEYGISQSEQGLFDPHIFERLKNDFRRDFDGGQYLLPATLRYAIQHPDSATEDQSCVFFSFPYLSLMKPQAVESKGQKSDHVPRTLLQSKYRLHDTKDRDKTQRITSLGLDVLKKYVDGSITVKEDAYASLGRSERTISLIRRIFSWLPGFSPDPFDDRLHIPQLWGLLPGSNNLITCDTCSVDSLCGESVNLISEEEGNSPRARPLLKLRFRHANHFEELYCPLDHCSSWYELLSKHLAIEESLIGETKYRKISKKENDMNQHESLSKATTSGADADVGEIKLLEKIYDILRTMQQNTEKKADSQEHSSEKIEVSFYIEGQNQALDAQSWTRYLRDNPNEELVSIEIRKSARKDITTRKLTDEVNAKKDDPDLSKQTLTIPKSPTVNSSKDKSPIGTVDKNVRRKNFPDLSEITYNRLTFFEWSLCDEFNQTISMPVKEIGSKFLEAIFEKLLVQKDKPSWRIPSKVFDGSVDVTLLIIPSKYIVFRQWFETNVGQNLLPDDPAQRLFDYSKRVLMFFLPEYVITADDLNSGSLDLYWGAVQETISKYLDSQKSEEEIARLDTLSEILANFMKTAKKIHNGAWSVRREVKPAPGTQVESKEGLMERAVLLSALVEAFSRILLLPLIATVHSEAGDAAVTKYVPTITAALERAQGQLIREADKDFDLDTPGSLLTPEGAAIALMNRLVSGTCRKASLDVKGMYELCLENMSVEVEYEASRGLLKNLNGFVEEVTVIIDVLKQQTNVLLQFRASLDPAHFYNPPIARRLQFRHESREIDKILLRIRGQLRAFEELKLRAKHLAVENVQLVETSQEQNGKYLFVFTVVTVLFLPPSFVAGFFGMNLQGFSPLPWTVAHFWEIAIPLTVGVVIAAMIFAKTIDDFLAAWSRWWGKKKKEWLAI